jgi:glycosyltransferase involved in cell wall biosynthesis
LVAAARTCVPLLLPHPDLPARHRRRGRLRVEAIFGWPALATRTIALYEELLRQRGS